MYAFETLAIHAGEEPDPTTGALTPPIHTSTAFKLPGFGPKLFDALMMESHQSPHAYVRWGHPTTWMLEEKVTTLEYALRARTVKGLVGPAAYAVLKRLQK